MPCPINNTQFGPGGFLYIWASHIPRIMAFNLRAPILAAVHLHRSKLKVANNLQTLGRWAIVMGTRRSKYIVWNQHVQGLHKTFWARGIYYVRYLDPLGENRNQRPHSLRFGMPKALSMFQIVFNLVLHRANGV